MKFLALLVPSRLEVAEYRSYLDDLMTAAGRVNVLYGDSSWEPIRLPIGDDYERGVAALQLYDVLMVNAIVDGMNLVAKEGSIVNSKVHPGYPWDLLRTLRPDVSYVVVSRERQRALARLFNCPPETIQVIYNGVDPAVLLGLSPNGRALIERLDLPASDLIVLMPVRITAAKNIELALRVMAVLKARGCRPRLVVTGPPDPHDAESLTYFQSLRELRTQLSLESEARLVFESGPSSDQPCFIDEQQVAELFRVSDVLFMPSHREGFGLPALEAGLIGIPVVCTDVPAAREIGGEDVLRFDAAESPESIADLIQAWAQHGPVHRLRRKNQSLEVRRENARWIGPSHDERLTLVTCWPRNDNTHRLILVALPVP